MYCIYCVLVRPVAWRAFDSTCYMLTSARYNIIYIYYT